MYAKPQLEHNKLCHETLEDEFQLKSNNHNQSFRNRQYANKSECRNTSGS